MFTDVDRDRHMRMYHMRVHAYYSPCVKETSVSIPVMTYNEWPTALSADCTWVSTEMGDPAVYCDEPSGWHC